jgi:two-component system, chemotaxis family, protein-glutamate methylesterase/glutaminase
LRDVAGARCTTGAVVIRVLLVDDSITGRRALRQRLCAEPDIDVVAEAPDPYVAGELVVEHEPDVVLLDIGMPRMNGITFLRKLMRQSPTPVVVCVSFGDGGGKLVLEAFDAGAIDAVCRPAGAAVDELGVDLVRTVRAAAASRRRSMVVARRPVELNGTTRVELLAMGAATGGATALEAVVSRLPASIPPLLIVQHMPGNVTKALAARLDRQSRLSVEEARDGRLLQPGLALLAPGDRHVEVVRAGRDLRCRLSEQPRVNGHRPSIDVLFHSVAQTCGPCALAALLTGMGKDGAQGMLQLREAGAHTLAQDERTSIVFGMPRAAIELGAACEIVSLDEMAPRLMRALELHSPERGQQGGAVTDWPS